MKKGKGEGGGRYLAPGAWVALDGVSAVAAQAGHQGGDLPGTHHTAPHRTAPCMQSIRRVGTLPKLHRDGCGVGFADLRDQQARSRSQATRRRRAAGGVGDGRGRGG